MEQPTDFIFGSLLEAASDMDHGSFEVLSVVFNSKVIFKVNLHCKLIFVDDFKGSG